MKKARTIVPLAALALLASLLLQSPSAQEASVTKMDTRSAPDEPRAGFATPTWVSWYPGETYSIGRAPCPGRKCFWASQHLTRRPRADDASRRVKSCARWCVCDARVHEADELDSGSSSSSPAAELRQRRPSDVDIRPDAQRTNLPLLFFNQRKLETRRNFGSTFCAVSRQG